MLDIFGVQRIWVIAPEQSGYEAQFAEHLVLSDLNIKMPADVLHFTWNWVPADLFDAPTEQVAPQPTEASTTGNEQTKIKRPPISDLSVV